MFKSLFIAAVMAASSLIQVQGRIDSAGAASVVEPAIATGAEQPQVYLPMLEGERVGLFSNHTGVVGDRHTLDVLREGGIDVACVFAPEHGFRGTADAGEHVASGVDSKTGVRVVSLYGPGRAKAMAEAMKDIDVVVVDIQDVGLRYYTYYCTMLELMNEAARTGRRVLVLDRPNPNGMTVDGPVLDMKYESGVGRLPIPVCHGMTMGELARMIVGEGWLKDGRTVALDVVPCKGYTHSSRYRLPVPPSPNLPNMTAIYLYPSICFFEATPASLGRGTDFPFQVYGHPDMRGYKFEFKPQSRPGAKNPPLLGRLCHGVDLRGITDDEAIAQGVNLEYIIDAYRNLNASTGIGDKFFTSFFEKLIGRCDIRTMIEQGLSAEEIKATWADDVARFRQQRRPYLLYDEN